MADDVLVIPDTNSARHSRPTVPDFGTDYVERGLELSADFDAGLLSVSDGAALHSFDNGLYYARDIGRRTGERQLAIPAGTSALYYDFDAKEFAFGDPGEPALQVGRVDADAETVTDVSRTRSENFGSVDIDKMNNSPLVGSRYHRGMAGETFGEPRQTEWWTDGAHSLSTSGTYSLSGQSSLDFEHSGDGDFDDTALYPFIPQNINDTTASWIAANHTIDIAFTVVGSNTNGRNLIAFRQNENSSEQLMLIEAQPTNTLQFYDGDGVGGGSFLDTGVSINDGDEVSLSITFDFDTNSCDIDYDVSGTSGVESGLSFQHDRPWYNSIVFRTVSDTVENTISLDRWQFTEDTWFALGDSITRSFDTGTLASDGTDGYVYQLNKQTDAGIFTRNTNGGGTVAATNWVREKVDDYQPLFRGSKVIVATGVKAVSTPGYSKDAFINQYLGALGEIRSNGGEPIGWLMTRRSDVDLSEQQEWIDSLRVEFERYNIPYIDAWDATTNNDGTQDTSLFSDAVHPNSDGHDVLTEQIINDLGL